jgi:hypothetical protein
MIETTKSSLAIAIVTHNHATEIAKCLDALESVGQASGAHVVIWDSGSTDESVAVASGHSLNPVVMSGENIGFGAGCNMIARSLPSEIRSIMFLNPDTEILFDVIDLLNYCETLGEYGCVGVTQRAISDRSIVWSWDYFPSPSLEWEKALRKPLLQRSLAGYEQDRDVDWVMGSFLLIPRETFEALGGFDERFYLFNEEVDLCHRIKSVGQRVVYVNEFEYLHKREGKDTLWREVVRINSRRTYDDKWLSWPERISCQLAQSYRWLTHLVRPTKPSDRRWALPRLLATWSLLHAETPHQRGLIKRRGSIRPNALEWPRPRRRSQRV